MSKQVFDHNNLKTVTVRISKNENQINLCYHNYVVASWSEITPCNKIDKPQVVYRFSGIVMSSIITLHTYMYKIIYMQLASGFMQLASMDV